MKPKFLVVYAKELKETLRDRRALSLLALFVLMYPCLLGFILHNSIDRATRPEREGINLVVIGAGQAPTLMAKFRQKNVSVTAREAMTEAQIGALLRARDAVAVLRLSDKF